MEKTFRDIIENKRIEELNLNKIPVIGGILKRSQLSQIVKTMTSSTSFKKAIKDTNRDLEDVVDDIKVQISDMDDSNKKRFLKLIQDTVLLQLDINKISK